MRELMMLLSLCVQDDPAVKEALEKFKVAYKSKDVAERASAVAHLARTQHDKVIARLGALLVVDDVTVRIEAAKGISGATGDLKKKGAALLARAFGPNAGQPLVSKALVEALETLQDGLGYAILKANLRSPDVSTSRAAIEAAGEIRDKSFVAPLIELLKALEASAREALNTGPGARTVTGGGLPGVGGPVGDPDAPKRARLLTPIARKSLEGITQQSFKYVREWEEWWRRNEADFKVEK